MTAVICFAVPCIILLSLLVVGEVFGKKKTWNF